MRLEAECPRCAALVHGSGATVDCPTHGPVAPLWRSVDPCYEAFAEHLTISRGLPTLMLWPLPVGWQVTDFGCVGGLDGGLPLATFVTCGGPSELDGVVEVTVVSEEPGVGLAGRCGRIGHDDPGADTADDPPLLRIDVDGVSTPLWIVSTADTGGEVLDRVVLAGEALGRWLWLVLRPASAALSLEQLGSLADVAGFGPALVSLPFTKVPRPW
jgi:hypothetical protein